MNSNGEGSNQPLVAAPVTRESGVGAPTDPLSNLKKSVAEAALEAVTPVITPLPNSVDPIQPVEERFLDQFGDPGSKPSPVLDSGSGTVGAVSDLDTTLAGLTTVSSDVVQPPAPAKDLASVVPADDQAPAETSEPLTPAKDPLSSATEGTSTTEQTSGSKQELQEAVKNVGLAVDVLKKTLRVLE